MFCRDINLPVDHEDFFTKSSPLFLTAVLALYAQHLASGNSLLSRSIKCDTIKSYVRQCSQFLMLFAETAYDFRHTSASDKTTHPYLQGIYDEVSRLEKIEDLREPFTTDMLKALHSIIQSEGHGPDSIHAALADWFECGLFLGFRKSEWAQDSGHYNIHSQVKKDRFGNTRAFVFSDIVCLDANSRRNVGFCSATIPERMQVTFRTQKNGRNGERKLCAKNPNPSDSGLCFTTAMHNIQLRHQRLCGHFRDVANIPLAVFKDPNHDEPRNITADEITSVMRECAQKAYGLDPNNTADAKTLKLWTSHSLRVGACNILHAMNVPVSKIQDRLRWCSTAFTRYLRNLAVDALAQTKTMEEAASVRFFL